MLKPKKKKMNKGKAGMALSSLLGKASKLSMKKDPYSDAAPRDSWVDDKKSKKTKK